MEGEDELRGTGQMLGEHGGQAVGRHDVEADARRQVDAAREDLDVPLEDRFEDRDLAGDVKVVRARAEAALDHRRAGEDERPRAVKNESDILEGGGHHPAFYTERTRL